MEQLLSLAGLLYLPPSAAADSPLSVLRVVTESVESLSASLCGLGAGTRQQLYQMKALGTNFGSRMRIFYLLFSKAT
jgi:hypothetical protein